MTLDHDGKIRMDCSSPYAMAGLVALKDRFQVAVGNDPDADRHGIVTASAGLMNPNHYLAVAIHYLLANRPAWPPTAAIGKTIVSSSMIDLVTKGAGRRLAEVPVGFKWFAAPLFESRLCFGGEESAGASFLRREWHGLDDRQGRPDPGAPRRRDHRAHRARIPASTTVRSKPATARRTTRRIDAPATPDQKAQLQKLSPEAVTATSLAGEPILNKLTRAPENDAPIDGLKVVAASGWFAATAVRNRGHLQDLRGELQEPRPPRRGRRRSAAHRRRVTQ